MDSRLVEALQRRGDATFLRFEDGSTRSGSELLLRANEIAGRLSARGVQAGDVVALRGLSTEDAVCALFGIWTLGAIAFPISHREPEAVVQEVLADARVCAQLIGSTNDVSVTAVAHRFELPGIATLLRTSGSSGQPKLAAHTLENHVVAATGACTAVGFEAGDTWLLSLPLFHVGGLSILIRAAVADGVVAVPSRGLTAEALDALQPTHVSAVATQIAHLDAGFARLRACKAVLLGGSAIPQDVRDLCEEGIRLYVSYGSTESTAVLAASGDAQVVLSSEAAGPPLPDRQIAIAADGEILIGGPTVFAGYLSREGLVDVRDKDGMFATGDMGYLDEGGVLFVNGRKDRMFISGGENVHPEEIETALEMIEGVERAIVVSVPDAKYGQRPEAFVRLEPGEAIDRETFDHVLETHLPRFKRPDRFWRMPDGDVEPRHLEQLVEERDRLTAL